MKYVFTSAIVYIQPVYTCHCIYMYIFVLEGLEVE